ncbi:MAG: bifunctional diaminohydroxyphosphoribosylaminopyrimidine deaminase/5-amino-6-(5-phosphoribosylamino)uracil reductase RibD [Bacteroidales bacterium]|nr:bifunctional diaminohydroxyphosphoribosylaminopyrimidine deaminase/5-amino-6-(5-phosphoribosylamino)uracil reductase RibD [Bacteroidales bacterium]
MRRALQLALNGRGGASPNPMVGAVIVSPDGRVIGEGWHCVRGLGHAEVNAVASVREADRSLLTQSTMYVTLEPCSHYGKTPPCAELILRTGIPRVVVATLDPNPKVAGKGIAMLREGGVEVETGMLQQEARNLNRRFFTSQLLGRPWITLKWACSADGFMDHRRTETSPSPYRFSGNMTGVMTMQLRSLHDAVLTTASTVEADDCRLTVRGWYGRQPSRYILDLRKRCGMNHAVFRPVPAEAGSMAESGLEADLRGLGPGRVITEGCYDNLPAIFRYLYCEEGVSSVLVEAGPTFLNSLIEAGLWDAAREEVAENIELGEKGRCQAPVLPGYMLKSSSIVDGSRLNFYLRKRNVDFRDL